MGFQYELALEVKVIFQSVLFVFLDVGAQVLILKLTSSWMEIYFYVCSLLLNTI